MRIVVTNCNTTQGMTEEIVRGARAAAGPGTTVTGLTPAWGPESAEGWLDSYLSAAAVLDTLRTYEEPYDAVVMAGFGEHGREGARELLDVPAVDITEAAAHLACLLGRRYGVVTTLDRTCGQIEDSLEAAGVGRNCAAIVGTGLGVLDLADTDRTTRAFLAAGQRARDAGAEVLVLGCAGMTGLQRTVGEKLGVPVVDGVGAAVKLAESLVTLGLTTSRAGSYAKPLPKRRTWGNGDGDGDGDGGGAR
ncbi:aspartate/glutamate racemase family protein [Streptomyces caniscabiei]|uniref:Aspartate/glutamate racemase family protein n=1 Tax=Streptomyces caniscabiei TaxID=2746961 RepID=A0ABU4MHD3_9ACTN|nr:aspartate/glutamate racemase family protein [Streptomyces caniscabiei]MBE4736079.1 Asp/Glu/hydantoin racemase [Streptomyces caniscabiei]MBE4755793.1 Asp/Glu/hydantoin racemase [Streptomyces caniscabiei]MBE4771619.1 Asp/Glu/hydantoin racemase [Streptomyces caniscabiei]MBE4785954.1 Asp/Glu/hydantoin racemase [Streptomyces caniscabiei]MBE4793975.1 Asp/Glu/hydantoin racemase [Streptomyces caniscabiei]